MSDRVLVDSGPIVAIFSASDEHHAVCSEQLRTLRGPLLTCWTVVTEAAWLLRASMRAVERLLASFDTGMFKLLPLDEPDLAGIAQILLRYRELKIQLADAALLHSAVREGIQTIFTLDRRDFGVMRLGRNKRLNLIP